MAADKLFSPFLVIGSFDVNLNLSHREQNKMEMKKLHVRLSRVRLMQLVVTLMLLRNRDNKNNRIKKKIIDFISLLHRV